MTLNKCSHPLPPIVHIGSELRQRTGVSFVASNLVLMKKNATSSPKSWSFCVHECYTQISIKLFQGVFASVFKWLADYYHSDSHEERDRGVQEVNQNTALMG